MPCVPCAALQVDGDTTVDTLKAIAEADCNIPAAQQTLVWNNRVLQDRWVPTRAWNLAGPLFESAQLFLAVCATILSSFTHQRSAEAQQRSGQHLHTCQGYVPGQAANLADSAQSRKSSASLPLLFLAAV